LDEEFPGEVRLHVVMDNYGTHKHPRVQACDLKLEPPASVLLKGKGSKERICPLWPETARALREYLEEQGIGFRETRTVFHNHRGYPLTRFGVRWILQKHVRQAGVVIKIKAASPAQSATWHGDPSASLGSRFEHDCPLAWTRERKHNLQISLPGLGGQTGSPG
jgi:hypothetical protein